MVAIPIPIFWDAFQTICVKWPGVFFLLNSTSIGCVMNFLPYHTKMIHFHSCNSRCIQNTIRPHSLPDLDLRTDFRHNRIGNVEGYQNSLIVERNRRIDWTQSEIRFLFS